MRPLLWCWHACAVAAAAEQVVAAVDHLIEEALVLEHFAEDDVQHVAVAGMSHVADARAPARDKRGGIARVFLHE